MKKIQKIMKAIFTILTICLLTIATVETSFAKVMRGHTIIIVQRPDTPGAPRTPVINPFLAELLEGCDSVLLEATDIVGTVYVQITSTAGDNYSTLFDTSEASIILPISGNAGYYTLTISYGGIQFVGEFTI